MHVAETVVGIDREVVRHGTRWRTRKAVGQGQRASGGELRDIRRICGGISERRLEREILNHGAILREVVVDAVARAHDHFLFRLPGHSNARCKIIAVRLNQRIREDTVVRQNEGGSGKPGRYVQVCHAIVRFRVRPVVFVAEPQVERQVRPEPPVILNKEIVGIRAEIVGACPELQRGLLRIAQQEIGEVVARVYNRNRASRGVLRRCESREYETSFRVSR